ncbi:BQ2448_3224 [Microbotryum intermedium]|uniref:BQ2448_3224 protein n=1 Tax=Microbotryum intermedium TaxID=269621 RepID=A0A238FKP4_9BASI|nr:BQ2448_3224 [Microbotryum intermedium]
MSAQAPLSIENQHRHRKMLMKVEPARSTSMRKLALQGTVESPDYHLLEPEYEEDGKMENVLKASKGGDRGFPGGSVYRMSTLTGTLDDMVREVLLGGEVTRCRTGNQDPEPGRPSTTKRAKRIKRAGLSRWTWTMYQSTPRAATSCQSRRWANENSEQTTSVIAVQFPHF